MALVEGTLVVGISIGFTCFSFYRICYLIMVLGAAIAMVAVVVIPGVTDEGRATVLVASALSGVVPSLHFLCIAPAAMAQHFAPCFALMLVFYLGGAAIYIARIPERWFPGGRHVTLKARSALNAT